MIFEEKNFVNNQPIRKTFLLLNSNRNPFPQPTISETENGAKISA